MVSWKPRGSVDHVNESALLRGSLSSPKTGKSTVDTSAMLASSELSDAIPKSVLVTMSPNPGNGKIIPFDSFGRIPERRIVRKAARMT